MAAETADVCTDGCNDFYVPYTDFYPEYEGLGKCYPRYEEFKLEDHHLDQLTEIVKERFPQIKRGDLVNILPKEYRHIIDSTHIWNGERVIAFSRIKESSSKVVPSEFIVSEEEFSPTWWHGMCHNGYWWPSEDIRNQAVSNITVGELEYLPIDCDNPEELAIVMYTTFKHKEDTYTVVFDTTDTDINEFKLLLSSNQIPYETTYTMQEVSDSECIPEKVCRIAHY